MAWHLCIVSFIIILNVLNRFHFFKNSGDDLKLKCYVFPKMRRSQLSAGVSICGRVTSTFQGRMKRHGLTRGAGKEGIV